VEPDGCPRSCGLFGIRLNTELNNSISYPVAMYIVILYTCPLRKSHSDSDDQMSVSEVEEVQWRTLELMILTWSVSGLQKKLDLRAARCSAAIFTQSWMRKVLLTGLKFELVRKTLINYQLSSLTAGVD